LVVSALERIDIGGVSIGTSKHWWCLLLDEKTLVVSAWKE
jgi:hypothetical protein